MSEKTLKFDNIEVKKKEFHASKQAIDLNLLDINKIVISDKFKHRDKGFKYFIGNKDDNIFDRYYYFASNEWIHKIFRKRRKKYVFYD